MPAAAAERGAARASSTRRPPPGTRGSTPLAPAQRPQELLTVLAEQRAAAYRAADPARLAAAESTAGTLHRRDAAAVATLRAAGTRYDGLRYRVTDVAVRSVEADRAVLRATVGVGAHRVVRPGDDTDVRAVRGKPVLVELVRTADGWRLDARAGPT